MLIANGSEEIETVALISILRRALLAGVYIAKVDNSNKPTG